MSLEIIETLINDCSDDCYFGSRLESSLLKSSTLNLARTALKNVNYQSYYLHFILGPILSLPFFPYLMNIHGIEDIFIKWETLHSETFVRKNPQILKIAITKRIQANKKSIIFRSFSFDPKESSLFESSRVTNDDIKDLIKCFKAKNRPLDDYSFSSALHYSLIKPDDGKPYDIRQELNVIYGESKSFNFLDIFQTVSSENSPIQVLELVLSLANLQKKFADFTMQHINDATAAKFMDLTDQALLNIDLDQVFSKEGMRLFFDSIIQIYRYYDDKFDSRFSASRIDHCGFVHGILMMNMQEKYKLQVYVENNEIMYHDTIQMVIQEMTSPGSGSIDLFEKPIVIEFQDQGAETGVIRTISKVKKAGQIKLLPHIQTLADNCFFMAVNLISPTSNPALIKIPLVKLNDDKAENLISIIRNGADKMYKATNEAEYAVESITKTADEIIEKMTAYISTIQNEKQIYHVPSDVRYLSLYVLGEASTSDLPIHMAEYTNKDPRDTFFSSVEQFVTTFVLETGNQKYDIVFNIFEGPKKYVESDLKFLPRKSSPKVEKRLVIDLKIFPRHRLSQFQYSDDYVMKDFIDKRISISNFNDDHFIPYYPNVDSNLILVPKSPIVHVSSLNPQNPATPKTIGKSTRKLLFNFRHLITNDKLLEALFRGVLNGQNIASITDGLANEKSLIFATDQLKLMKIRFFTIRSDMLDMTKQILTLKNKEQHIDKSYSIILHMEAQNVRNTVTVVVDSGSNLGNVESLVDSCVGRSRRSADACGISLEKLPRPKNPRLRRVLDKINEISSITSHGILLKDMLGDLFNGDLVGLAVNLGIVSTGIAVSQGVEKLSKIYAAEKGALGFSIKLGAPFLRRLTSGFIIYDLINNIQNYQDDTTAVSIAQDSTFLLVDTMDIGSEIAQMLGFTTAEFLGPLGFTVGITLFVGGDIYKAVKTVENVDRLFHLTINEKWELGAKLFFHMDVKSIVQNAEKRHFNEQKVEFVIKALERHGRIRYYVSIIDEKRDAVIYFDYPPFQDLYSRKRLICTSDPIFLSFNNLYKVNLQLLTCQNAFIVENTNSTKPEIIFMDLRNTSSQVIGFSNYSHIFSISNAEYDITGGNGDDTFVVSGNSINGYLDGAEGFDTLDLGQIDTNSPVYMTPETLEIGESYICFRNVNYVQGRLKSYDHVETWYELERIDLLGGADYYNFDQIHVHDHRNLQVTVRNLTNITFHENITGNFVTTFPYLTSWSDTTVDRNYGNTTFLFLMNFESIQANMKNENDTLYFQWNKISGCISQLCIIKFKDNLTIHTKNYIAELTTNLTLDQILLKYDQIHRLLKCLLIVQAVPENSVILFAHSIPNKGPTILHNDPSRQTHFFGSVGENIFVIKPIDNRTIVFKEVAIHRNSLKSENLTDTIEFKFVKNFRHKLLCSIKNDDVFIRICVEDKFSSNIVLKSFATFYKNLLLIGNVPMKIEVNESCVVRPVPLKFNRNETLIIVKNTDVEYDHQIIIERSIGKRHVFYNNNDMIFTDFFFKSRNNTGFMLILESFYGDEKMRTLKIKISGKVLDLHSEEFDKNSALPLRFLEYILY